MPGDFGKVVNEFGGSCVFARRLYRNPITMNYTLPRLITILAVLFFVTAGVHSQQQKAYPSEIRGYKVERAAVQLKKNSSKTQPTSQTYDSNPDELIRFGQPKVMKVTPLGVKLEIPVVVSPVTQKGKVDFLLFENMVVNGTPVEIEEYKHSFSLPNNKDLVLDHPLKFTVNVPNTILAAIGEWTNSKERWLVTGRVYVFGRYKKFLFTFKRTIPVELNLTIRNPMRKT